MSHYVYPVDFFFWTKAKNHARNKEKLMGMVESTLKETASDHEGKWPCVVNTEFFAMLDGKAHDYWWLIQEELYPAMDAMFDEMPELTVPKRSTVVETWYNRYEEGYSQDVHAHTARTLSGIYLVDLQEENTTAFFSYGATSNFFVNAQKRAAEAVEGDIILFPSHLLHYVLPSKKPRTTIAFNIQCEF